MKKIIAWALCLLIAGGAAMAEVYSVSLSGSEEREGCALLISDEGELLTPLDAYASIFELTPKGTPEGERRFCAQSLQVDLDLSQADLEMLVVEDYYRVALMDPSGKLLTGFDYWDMEWAGDKIRFHVPGEDSGTTGVMDLNGRVVIEPVYYSLQPLGGGRWLALVRDQEAKTERFSAVLLDEDGQTTDLDLHTDNDAQPAGNGEICPMTNVEEFAGDSVYVNREGKICFGRSFESADPFMGGCAVVQIDGKSGLINREGKLVVQPEYECLSHSGEAPNDVYITDSNCTLVVYDAGNGEQLMRREYKNADFISANLIAPGLLWVYMNDHSECCRTDGTLLATFPQGEDRSVQYGQCTADAPRFTESVGHWPDSRTHLIDIQVRQLSGDYQGMYDVRSFDDQPLYTCYVYNIYTDQNGEAMNDWRSWRYGVVDENGTEVLKPEYLNEVQVLSPDRFWVTAKDRSGLIDASGKWYYTISSYDSLMD